MRETGGAGFLREAAMSFRELLQAIAMLVPTLLVVIAAAVSISHSDDRTGASGDPVAASQQVPRKLHARFDVEPEGDDEQ